MVRIRFEKEQQRMFLDFIKQKNNLSLRKIAKKCDINYELLKKYRQEICFMDENIFLKLCKIGGINKSSLAVSYLDSNWGQVKGGKIGMARMRDKYTSKIREWCSKGGKQ